MRDDLYREWPFTSTTLFKTPGNDGVKFINRARFMMLLLGIALGIVRTLLDIETSRSDRRPQSLRLSFARPEFPCSHHCGEK